MSYYFNDLMSNQLKPIDEKVQHDGLILLVFVSKNCQSGHRWKYIALVRIKNQRFSSILELG